MTERTLVIDTDKFLEANVPEVVRRVPKDATRVFDRHGKRFVDTASGKVLQLIPDVPAERIAPGDGKIDRSSCYGR